jgi:endoglucanase
LAVLVLALATTGCTSGGNGDLKSVERTLLPGSTISTSSLPAGTSDWTLYESPMAPLTDGSAVMAMPVVSAKGGMRGTAYFDLVTVIEYGPRGTEIREVAHDDLSLKTIRNWYEWSSGSNGNQPPKFVRETVGYQDDGSLSISNAEGAQAVTGWSNDQHLFKVMPGNQYRIRGYMRGQDIELAGTGTDIGFHLDFYKEKQ